MPFCKALRVTALDYSFFTFPAINMLTILGQKFNMAHRGISMLQDMVLKLYIIA